MIWRIVQAPERWSLVAALLEEPAVRPGLEFFVTPHRASARRSRPAFLVVDAISHRDDGVIDIEGRLVRQGDRVCRPVPVHCRVWTTTREGSMTTAPGAEHGRS
jgi:hypothetical protein